MLVLVSMALVATGLRAQQGAEPAARPNIVWITVDDVSPDFGCYATTIGAHQRRSRVELPPGYEPVTAILARHGYRCTRLPYDNVGMRCLLAGDAPAGRMALVNAHDKTDFNFWRDGDRERRLPEWVAATDAGNPYPEPLENIAGDQDREQVRALPRGAR